VPSNLQDKPCDWLKDVVVVVYGPKTVNGLNVW
jgi:hypothetical protein